MKPLRTETQRHRNSFLYSLGVIGSQREHQIPFSPLNMRGAFKSSIPWILTILYRGALSGALLQRQSETLGEIREYGVDKQGLHYQRMEAESRHY